MRDGLILNLLSIVPRRWTSRTMGRLSRLRLPRWLLRQLLRWYVAHYGVKLHEAADPLDSFPNLASFFTRALKPGVRPVADADDAVVSPVDGKVYVFGTVQDGRLPQAPELDYAVSTLLGDDPRYDDGEYAVIYLAPKDYHRVHYPREGQLVGYRYRPGRLWPVFPAATRKVRDLFAENERLVARVSSAAGEYALVMVGAFGVGRMRTTFCDLVTNWGAPKGDEELGAPLPVERAAELGRFEMGSTVVLVFPKGSLQWELEQGRDVQLGERIATIVRTPSET